MAAGYRVLVVSAHPDDVEFACAGTLIRWVDEGAEVVLCIATDGSTGTQDRSLMGAPLADLRRIESERAAELMGVTELVWLGYRDGYVEYTLGLRRDLARIFRRFRPHRFVVMEPASTIEDRFINHPDHRAVGQACLDVAMTAGTTPGHFPELLEEGLEPWRGLREVWVAGPGAKPVAVDIEATLDRKIEALLCHATQLGDEPETIATWVREWAGEQGDPHGFAAAETFRLITQGPGFHEETEPEAGIDLGPPPLDPRA